MIEDLTGQKFGKLTAVSFSHVDKYTHRMWLCECECGNFITTRAYDLKRGKVKSCGCSRIKYKGIENKRIISILQGIKKRCLNKNCKDYANYGGRGIKIYQEWIDNPITFYNWAMANGYQDDLTIDRIDVNGNYEPSNCRWANKKQQANNRRNNRFITYKGETHSVSEWLRILGLLK